MAAWLLIGVSILAILGGIGVLTGVLQPRPIEPVTGGVFTDRGTARGSIQYNQFTCSTTCSSFPSYEEHAVSEQFLTSTGVSQVLPTDKSQCKRGGFEQFGFSSEKECKDAVKAERKPVRQTAWLEAATAD
jgi:hypothetical protein